MMTKKNVKITNQHDIDAYIDQLIAQAEKEIEVLFANRLKVIKREIADMFERYQTDDVYVTWTEFNKYNRLNKELTRIGEMLTDDYRQVAKTIQKSQEDSYIEKFMMSLYLYELSSQKPISIKVPSAKTIRSAIEQPIEFIKLAPTLQRHRNEVLKKIRIHITQGIMSGEGYPKIAKALRDDLGMSKAQSQRVARTEAGRAMSQAGLDSARVAKDNGVHLNKRWHATRDGRTRDTHRHLDGQELPINKNFKSSGCVGPAPRMFVGVASAKENINCRCSLLYFTDKDELPTVMRVRNELVPFTTYREWEKQKLKG